MLCFVARNFRDDKLITKLIYVILCTFLNSWDDSHALGDLNAVNAGICGLM